MNVSFGTDILLMLYDFFCSSSFIFILVDFSAMNDIY